MESGPAYDDSIEALQQITGIESHAFDSESKLMAKARFAQDLIDQLVKEGVSREEITTFASDVIDELDNECPYKNQPVFISGLIYRPVQGLNDHGQLEWGYTQDTVEDLEVISHGFLARYDDKGILLGHTFALVGDRHDTIGSAIRSTNIPQGYADVDKLVIDYKHTVEEAVSSLQNFAGNLIDEIDEALFNTGTLTDTLQELAEIRPYKLYHDVQSEVLADSALYIAEKLAFDAAVPYELEIKGTYLRPEGEDKYAIVVPDASKADGGSKRILGYIQAVEFTNDRTIVGGECVIGEGPHFALLIRVVHDERSGGSVDSEIQVLMKDIVYCESLRELLKLPE